MNAKQSIVIREETEAEGEKLFKADSEYIYISFWDRPFWNKVLWLIYKIYRGLYVSCWFYFLPFLSVLGSYAIPLLLHKNHLFDHFEYTPKAH